MLVVAALVPDTVLLLAGAAGRGPDDATLVALRTSALAAVARAVAGATRTVVVAPGAVTRSVAGPVRAGAAAAGVPDHLLVGGATDVLLVPAAGAAPALPGAPGSGTVVGLRLALAAGAAPAGLHLLEVAPGEPAELRALGAATTSSGPTALVVVGSGSARHGDGAPLPADDEATTVDGALLAACTSGGRAARDALADLDAGVARRLAATGWAPWQVLVGALDATGQGADLAGPELLHASVLRGAAHAAVVWAVAP
ncbi:hypothetical protein [Cellulomonas phragmiteti]|uniref:Uncharacterized protein n=1 Tax=Cellulomonas phragmiteti TaxID=478780 RepID=A0ABQ4DGR3_9CELL|nr:hypothetical protein [Cellulomonas phragmiteti]GIG38515.1 hypothetical protein Cph01nite_02770 [Cellulomonas phragmiteti]